MPTITIRNVPTCTRNELAARAALAGRSLQEHLRLALDPSVGPTPNRHLRSLRTRPASPRKGQLPHDPRPGPIGTANGPAVLAATYQYATGV